MQNKGIYQFLQNYLTESTCRRHLSHPPQSKDFVENNQQDLNIEIHSMVKQCWRCTSKQDIMTILWHIVVWASICVCLLCVAWCLCTEICHITSILNEVAHHDSASSPQPNVSLAITSHTLHIIKTEKGIDVHAHLKHKSKIARIHTYS